MLITYEIFFTLMQTNQVMRKITIIPLILVVMIFCVMPLVDAELLTIKGSNDYSGILIGIDDNQNIIKWLTKDGHFEKQNSSKVKLYNSGGFTFKNVEMGIKVWGHPTSDTTQYKLTILYGNEFQKMTASTIDNSEFANIKSKSSVGADISKYDIPTEGRKEITSYVKPEKVHDPDSLDMIPSVPQKVSYKHNFNFDFTAIDTQIKSQNDQRLTGVSVFTTIFNPIGEIMGTWNGTTGNMGLFGDQYYIIENQMIGEYKIETTMKKDNYNPVTKMISFFVLPSEDNDSNKSCPSGYWLNNTAGFCQVICQSGYVNNESGQCRVN